MVLVCLFCMAVIALVFLIGFIPLLNTWQSRIKIGQFTSNEQWKQKIVSTSSSWLTKTPLDYFVQKTLNSSCNGNKIALGLNPLDYFKKYLEYIVVLIIILVVLFGINNVFPKINFGYFIFKIILCLLTTNALIYYFYKNKPESKGFLLLVDAMFNKIMGKFL